MSIEYLFAAAKALDVKPRSSSNESSHKALRTDMVRHGQAEEMQHKAELGDGVARQKFAEVHGGLEVRRIFLNSLERNAKEKGLEG